MEYKYITREDEFLDDLQKHVNKLNIGTKYTANYNNSNYKQKHKIKKQLINDLFKPTISDFLFMLNYCNDCELIGKIIPLITDIDNFTKVLEEGNMLNCLQIDSLIFIKYSIEFIRKTTQ